MSTCRPARNDSNEASLVRVVQRDYDRERKLPTELVEEMSRTFALGHQVWVKARAEKDFSQFQDILAKIVDLNIQQKTVENKKLH